MRVEAYNAVSQLYKSNSNSVSAVKKAGNAYSFSDKLEISHTANSYHTARAAVNSASDVRMDKVASIKAQMEAGTYSISSEAVADKILDDAQTIVF